MAGTWLWVLVFAGTCWLSVILGFVGFQETLQHVPPGFWRNPGPEHLFFALSNGWPLVWNLFILYPTYRLTLLGLYLRRLRPIPTTAELAHGLHLQTKYWRFFYRGLVALLAGFGLLIVLGFVAARLSAA